MLTHLYYVQIVISSIHSALSIHLHCLANKNSSPQVQCYRLQRTSASSSGIQIKPSGTKQFISVHLIPWRVRLPACNT